MKLNGLMESVVRLFLKGHYKTTDAIVEATCKTLMLRAILQDLIRSWRGSTKALGFRV